MQIYNEGGGIHFTVRHVREASTEALCEALVSVSAPGAATWEGGIARRARWRCDRIGRPAARPHASHAQLAHTLAQKLDRMLRTGTTVAEVKSGYGLDLDTEVKMLKVVELARGRSPVHLLSTYLAHSVPKGRTAAEVTKEIVESHFPVIKRLMDQGEIRPAFVDVFCEKGVFELEDTRKILAAGAQIGLALNFHGDELSPIRAAELAAEMKAASVAHLEHISDEGIEALAKHGVVGVLLPTTAYVLRIPYPPARRMIDRGVAVALGSDFNPNAWCFSLPFVMNLACVQMRLTLSEALVACTLNAAAALNCSKEYGSLEVGKRADFLVLSEPLWEHLVYRMCDPPIRGVYKGGRAVHGH